MWNYMQSEYEKSATKERSRNKNALICPFRKKRVIDIILNDVSYNNPKIVA